jgi:hypothetical protein
MVFMRGRVFIPVIVALAVAAIVMELSWYRNMRRVEADRRAARGMQIGLNAQFMANPRFRNVWVIGYRGKARVFSVEESFAVAGWVGSKKDFADAWRILVALHPPGELKFTLSVRPPPQRIKNPARPGGGVKSAPAKQQH